MTRRQRIISFCIAMIGVLIILAIIYGRTDKEDTFTPQPEEYSPTERRTDGESAETREIEIKKLAFAVDTHSISESARLSTHIFNLAAERGNIFNPLKAKIEDAQWVCEKVKQLKEEIAQQEATRDAYKQRFDELRGSEGHE